MTTTTDEPSVPWCARCGEPADYLLPASCPWPVPDAAHAKGDLVFCPECRILVRVGEAHPWVCVLCRDRRHPVYDAITPSF